MAIDLLTNPGGLFVRLGKIFGGINEENTARGATLNSRVATINAQYLSTNQDIIENLYTNQQGWVAAGDGQVTGEAALTNTTLIQMANDDTPLPNLELITALDLLIEQMIANSDTIERPVVGSSVTAGSGNVGTGKVTISTIGGDGQQLDYLFEEDILCRCSASGYVGGGGTSGSETFSITSPLPAPNSLSWQWPGASGTSNAANALNPALTSGLFVTDGNFENWVSTNTPVNWTIQTGVAGTTIFRSSTAYLSTYAIQFTGNGSELTAIRQTITDLQPQTVYAFSAFVRTDGSVAAGVLRARLLDGGGSPISDSQGTVNSVSVACSTLTNQYTQFSGFFRLPSIVPTSGVQLEIGLSTALTNTEVLLIDAVSLQAATQLYAGGPFLAIVAGNVNFSINDYFTIAMTNSFGVTSFARSLDRVWNLRELGRTVPSAASGATISNSLIS